MDIILTVISVVFVAIVLLKMLLGLRRGIGRQLVRFGCTALSAVSAFFITKAFCGYFSGTSAGANTVGKLLVEASEGSSMGEKFNIEEFIANSNSLDSIISLPVATVIAPFLFVVYFVMAQILAFVVYLLVCKIFKIERPVYEKKKNIFGCALGLVEGLLVASIIFTPIVAYSNIADDSVDAVRAKDEGSYTEFVHDYDITFGRVSKNFAVKIAGFLGANAVSDSFATVNIDGEEIALNKEFGKIVSIYLSFSALDTVDLDNLSPADKKAFDDAIDELEKSPYLRTLVSGIFSDIGRALGKGNEVLAVNPPYDMLVNDAISVIATSNKDNIVKDLHTVFDVYVILSDSGTLESYGSQGSETDMREGLISTDEHGETVVGRVVAILEANEHTRPLVNTLTHMTILMLTEQLGVDAETLETYNNLMNGFNSILDMNPESYATTEEYEAARNSEIESLLLANGIELEADVIDEIGDYADAEYSNHDTIDEEHFDDIMLYYFDAYLATQSN